MTEFGNREHTTRLAQRVAQRLESEPDYLAYLFHVLRTVEHMDDDALANLIGAGRDQLPRLALCRTPREDMFREDITEIADHFSLDPRRLATAVRRGQVLSAFSQASAVELLAAARDRAAEDHADYASDEEESPDSDEADGPGPQRPSGDPDDRGGAK